MRMKACWKKRYGNRLNNNYCHNRKNIAVSKVSDQKNFVVYTSKYYLNCKSAILKIGNKCRVKRNVWFGVNSSVMRCKAIRENSVVAADSVIIKDFLS